MMTREEAIKIIEVAKAEVELEAPLDYQIAFDLAIEALKQPAQQWIPVSERLPDNANVKGAFCPKYYVTTEFGQTEGWYNPDAGGWYVLLWFMDARFEEWNVSLDRGTVPKLVFGVPVIAWMPLPEPFKEG